MTVDDKIRDEKLLRSCEKYQPYHQEELINMNIYQVRKYYLLMKE